MAEQNNAYCTVCGKGYHLCISCSSHKLTPWRSVTDTSEHYKVHQILSAVTCGIYTKEEAKEKFTKVDLSDIETYKDDVKKRIKDIIGVDTDTEIDTQDNGEQIKNVDENSIDADTTDVEISGSGKPKKSTKKKKSVQTVETE